ncbi:MAG TPA: hypothetical protein VKJ65_06820 [Phycisphaerae bacterium]|nr:hypothetical protein [Phycisphaerae bacterium]
MRKVLYSLLCIVAALSLWLMTANAATTTAPDYNALEQAAAKGDIQSML